MIIIRRALSKSTLSTLMPTFGRMLYWQSLNLSGSPKHQAFIV